MEYRWNLKEIMCHECRTKCGKGQAVLYAKDKGDRWTGLCRGCWEYSWPSSAWVAFQPLLDEAALDPARAQGLRDDLELLALLASIET